MITSTKKFFQETLFSKINLKESDSLILSVTDHNYVGYWVQFDFEYGNLVPEIQKGIDKYFSRFKPLSPILLSETYYSNDIFKKYLIDIIHTSIKYPVFQQEWLNRNAYVIQVHVVEGVH